MFKDVQSAVVLAFGSVFGCLAVLLWFALGIAATVIPFAALVYFLAYLFPGVHRLLY